MAGTTQLRISLTISGAVALGAYEGGALAALLHAVRPLVGGDDAPVGVFGVACACQGAGVRVADSHRRLLASQEPNAARNNATKEEP